MAQGIAGLENIREGGHTEPQVEVDEHGDEIPVGRQPDDFETEDEFLAYVRESFAAGLAADKDNREQALEDLRFFSGDQWDPTVKAARTRAKKPTLTINRLPAFVQTFVANRRLNQTGIKVAPNAGGSKQIAKLREELIRGIEANSRADRAYDNAFQNAVICGVANFQVALEYAHDDVFEQDIRIERIVNPLSVVWDPMSTDLTGADARWCFVTDTMDKRDFRQTYPDAVAGLPTDDTRLLGKDLREENLSITDDEVDVVSFWRMRQEPATVAMMQTGVVEDVTDMDPAVWMPRVMTRQDGDPMVRETRRRFAEMYLVTATDILEGPYRLPIKRLPVFKVSGWEVNVGNYRRRFGLVRFLRDPQTLHNYWRTVVAEKLMRTPKQTWLAPDTAVEGREEQWRESHLNDDPLLVYNSESGAAPTRVAPAQLEDALINEASMTAQDIKDVSNIHESSLGMQSNEVSGKAVMARQRVGEAGLVIYSDNLNDAIFEAGTVVNDLIPIAYDTPRMVKVVGEDANSYEMIKINEGETNDITVGKYDITVSTGPSFATKRVEAQEQMMNMINAMPETLNIAADKIVEAQDWPGGDEIVRRLRMSLPPGMVAPDDLSPEQQQAMQAQAEAAEQVKQMEQAQGMAELEERRARAIEAVARAKQALGQAAKSFMEADLAPEKAWHQQRVSELNSIIQGISALNNVTQQQQRGRGNE